MPIKAKTMTTSYSYSIKQTNFLFILPKAIFLVCLHHKTDLRTMGYVTDNAKSLKISQTSEVALLGNERNINNVLTANLSQSIKAFKK